MKVFIALLFMTFAAHSAPVKIECRYDREEKLPADKDAAKWLSDHNMHRINFVIDLQTSEILEGPGAKEKDGQPNILYGKPEIEIKESQIIIKFDSTNAAPKARSPTFTWWIDRYTGSSMWAISLLEKEFRGPRYSYGGLDGKCKVFARQF